MKTLKEDFSLILILALAVSVVYGLIYAMSSGIVFLQTIAGAFVILGAGYIIRDILK